MTKVNEKRLVDTFLKLVKIDSPSGHEENVRDFIENALEDLGAFTDKDKFGNLIAKFEGQGKPFILATHMDTVQPGENIKPTIKGDRITSDGKTILGSDDKAGIAEVLEAIKVLKENKVSHRPLELVFTREEETGLDGAFNLDYKSLKAKEGFVIDNTHDPVVACVAAPFITKINIVVKGKAAHAGVEPEKGVDAIAVASSAISQIKWGRIDEETTCNIGTIKGGVVRNAVPDRVELEAEVRSHKKDKMEKFKEYC